MAASCPYAHKPFWRSRNGVALLVLGTVGAFFILTEHRAHVLGLLPYLILLACPLMHLFMHHGHHDHGQSTTTGAAEERRHERP